jgi:hypothetical protein
MTDNKHPISPSPELVQQWRNLPEYVSQLRTMSTVTITTEKLQDVATQAARWGADQELNECCHLLRPQGFDVVDDLRNARRPKPPSLKERALQAWAAVEAGTDDQTAMAVIRRALEALDD